MNHRNHVSSFFIALLVTVYGAAESAWSETIEHRSGAGRGTRTSFETLDFRGGEVFLNQQVCLLGAAMGAAIIPIRPGTHHYSFAFRMPTNLPASFEASHGYVRFKVMAVLDASGGQDKESSSEFTVFSSDDLRLDPTLRIPKSIAESKRFRSFRSFYIISDPAITTVTVPQTGFVPGQIVPVEIVHKNASSNDISATKVSIWRHIRFNGDIPQSGTKLECELIVEGQTGGCRRGEEKLYQCNLMLPSTLLKSNHEICRVVQVSYELGVESIIGRSGSKNIQVLIPIKIGSIPLDFIPPLPTQQIDEIQAAYLSAAEDLRKDDYFLF
jgi:Arrestin (or S-antigen), N-terminal domain/Arrestin (or S-antigen), C-terminal domain